MTESERINRKSELIGQLIELSGRATGRTTRIIDKYIQELYKHQGEWIEIKDHFPSPRADRMVLNKIMARMELEHPGDKVYVDKSGKPPRIKFVPRCHDLLMTEIKRLQHEIDELSKN